MSNLKELMTNGVFGETTNKDYFVVVGDKVIYQDGDYDEVNELANNQCFSYKVAKLVKDCRSFKMLEDGGGTVIYEKKKEEDEDADKSVDELMEELNKLLNDIKKDAKAKGLSDKEAKAVTDALLAAASIAALGEMFGEVFDKK